MLQSMTGYGEAVYQSQGIYYCAEVKTVNGKFLKSNLKLPDSAGFLEEDIEAIIRENIFRGTVYYSLQLKSAEDKPLAGINSDILSYYVKKLTQAASGDHCRIDLSNLLEYPGVIEPYIPDSRQQQEMKRAARHVTAEALEKLRRSREAEGSRLADELIRHCGEIEQNLEKICQKAPDVVVQYKQKLEKRVNELLKSAKLSLDEPTLIREVAIFADRCDISEETARLSSHIQQFKNALDSGDSIGRRLDFLCQEMFREVNTIGSKASDTDICQWVVDVKCGVERIKEQVQNVE